MSSELGWPEEGRESRLDTQGDPRREDPGSAAVPVGWPQTHDRDPDVSRETSGSGGESRSAMDTSAGSGPLDDPQVSRETSPLAVPTASAVVAGSSGLDDFMDTPIARETQAVLRGRAAVSSGNWLRPARPRVMVVANQKGGVGKTTTTVNLAASLALNKLRVLVVDLDPQGNASTALSVEHRSGVTSVYDALIGDASLLDMTQPVQDIPQLFCVPATIDLAGAEVELVPMVARESRLKRALAEVIERGGFDYIFLDCPPSLGLLTVNALVASSEVLIPIQCEYYALEGLGQLLHNIDLVKSQLNPDLDVSTVLLTMYDGRTRLSAQVADEVRVHFGDRVLGTVVPRSVRISEAPSYGQTVMTYDPGSTGALSYLEAAKELAQRIESAEGVR
jgi:chromosome partitioning protein